MVHPRWQPENLPTDQLRNALSRFAEPSEPEDSLREKAAALAKGGFSPY